MFQLKKLRRPLVSSVDGTQNLKKPCSFESALANKNLPINPFSDNSRKITLSAPLSTHAAWVYEYIYKYPYPNAGYGLELMRFPRKIHGLQHVSRAALYVSVFCNLYRKYNDPAALQLTEEDLKLLQIAALFHDSAREAEGVDKWDHESALFLYCYLTKTLKIDPHKAKLLAEAVANKDTSNNESSYTIIDQDGVVSIQLSTTQETVKNIYQKIIHDADCLDIIRARGCFDAQHLDFYKDIANSNDAAFEEMAYLITEARHLIVTGGDAFSDLNFDKKINFESQDGYDYLVALVNSQPNSILAKLSIGLVEKDSLDRMQLVNSKAYSPEIGLTEENVKAALLSGRVLARSIPNPSSIPYPIGQNKADYSETCGEIEVRKLMRRPGIPTRSSKSDKALKNGNSFRSTSLLGFGGGVFSNVGFLLVNPRENDVEYVGAVDIDSGFDKKLYFKDTLAAARARDPLKLTLPKLFRQLKMGGVNRGRRGVAQGYVENHTEVIYNVHQYDAIYFTTDRKSTIRVADTMSYDFFLLQALYLQKQYQIQYDKTFQEYQAVYGPENGHLKFLAEFGENRTLPIYEYSAQHNTIKLIEPNDLEEEKIVQLWINLYQLWINKQLSNSAACNLIHGLWQENVEELKIKIVNFALELDNSKEKRRLSLDCNYSDELKNKLNSALLKVHLEKFDAFKQSTKKKIISEALGWFSDEFEIINEPLFLKANAGLVIEKIVTYVSKTRVSTYLLDTEAKITLLRRMLTFSVNCSPELAQTIKNHVKFALINYINSMALIQKQDDRKFLRKIDVLMKQFDFSPSEIDEVTDCIFTKIFEEIRDIERALPSPVESTFEMHKVFYKEIGKIIATLTHGQPLTRMTGFNEQLQLVFEPLSVCKIKNDQQMLLYLFLASLIECDKQILKSDVTNWLGQNTRKWLDLMNKQPDPIVTYIHYLFPFQEHLDVLKLILRPEQFQNENTENNLMNYIILIQDLFRFLEDNSPKCSSKDLLKNIQCKQYVKDEFVRITLSFFNLSNVSPGEKDRLITLCQKFLRLLYIEQSGIIGDINRHKMSIEFISAQLDVFFNTINNAAISTETFQSVITSVRFFKKTFNDELRELIDKESDEDKNRHLDALKTLFSSGQQI